ncbi:MAG: DUF4160 domain-containing protein [Spirochaetaceae bacterium]|jgi:hypothetical protein|nr:DUF4160 domain-containing protein [Spirochaetaceae bacterium]
MPELSRFLDMTIRMFYKDDQKHHKPHIYVVYNDEDIVVSLDGEILDGSLPRKQMRILWAWLEIHEDELYKAWNEAVKGHNPGKIEPLR